MRLFSTEQISKYHPDKFADQISDAIVSACLSKDKHSRVACECMIKGTTCILGGEITTNTKLNYDQIVHRVAKKLNYKIDKVINLISKQSQEISKAVGDDDYGAGDQGIMFGYACSETKSMLPYGFDLANEIIKRIETDVETNPKTILKGDAKTQVTVDLDKKGNDSIFKVVISVCHKKGYTLEQVTAEIQRIMQGLPIQDKLIVNPAGIWTIGGAIADCGLTGRKIVCDQYGGYCAVGGGAFSGKDPTKVDRTASYMARRLAKQMCDKLCADEVKVQLAYIIGQKMPISASAEVIKGNSIEHYTIESELTPKNMIIALGILDWDLEKLSEGCHFRGDLI